MNDYSESLLLPLFEKKKQKISVLSSSFISIVVQQDN